MRNTHYKIKDSISRIFNLINFSSSSYYYYSRYYYYERLLSKYSDGQFYFNLVNKVKKNNEIKTTNEIKLIDGKKLKDIDVKDIVNKYGNPHHKIIYEDLLGIKVMLFKQKFGAYRTKLEFHFLNNTLFFYSYTFSDLKEENKSEIIQIIKDKYVGEELCDIKNDYIIDKNNIILMLNDNINLTIYYLCNNEIALKNIKVYIDSLKEENENKQKMYRKILYNKL